MIKQLMNVELDLIWLIQTIHSQMSSFLILRLGKTIGPMVLNQSRTLDLAYSNRYSIWSRGAPRERWGAAGECWGEAGALGWEESLHNCKQGQRSSKGGCGEDNHLRGVRPRTMLQIWGKIKWPQPSVHCTLHISGIPRKKFPEYNMALNWRFINKNKL